MKPKRKTMLKKKLTKKEKEFLGEVRNELKNRDFDEEIKFIKKLWK